MKAHWYVVLLSSVITLNCEAQKILVFDRDHALRIRFHINDEIAVRTDNNEPWEEGVITNILDSTITIEEDVIPVSKIKAIRFDSRSSWIYILRQCTVMLPAAGVVLLAIDAIDASSLHYSPVYSEGTLITASALIVAGPIAYRLTYHKYKINEHHRLKVIDVSIQ